MNSDIKSMNTKEKEQIIFDLMFYGCQSINAPMANEILLAIESGKIRGVKLESWFNY